MIVQLKYPAMLTMDQVVKAPSNRQTKFWVAKATADHPNRIDTFMNIGCHSLAYELNTAVHLLPGCYIIGGGYWDCRFRQRFIVTESGEIKWM